MSLSLVASMVFGPIQCTRPIWLLLIPVAWAFTFLLARRSLSGLGTATKWTAIALRLVVFLLLALAMSEPMWRREAKDIAVNVVIDASDSIPASRQPEVDAYVKRAAERSDHKEDRLGVLTVAKDAYVQSLPSRLNDHVERQHIGATDGTDLATGVRLAIATAPKDAGFRILLISDGNQTDGNVLQAAETAKAQGVPIDVLPVRYKYDNEVLVDRLVAPATAREGETINLRIVLQATKPARGRLTVLMNEQPVDLDPDLPGASAKVTLKAGLNVLQVPLKVQRAGPQKFDAVFEPDGPADDAVPQNNQSGVVTIVSGEGRVLVLCEHPEQNQPFLDAMEKSKIKTEVRAAAALPTSLTELNGFDAIIMLNESAYDFTQKAQEDLRQYIHETGGGLLMVGGPNSFGAGGWIGSPLEDALPVKLDPPDKRQMPKGALALVLHSVEAPDGVFLGKKVAESALNSLSRLDLFGMVEYGWGGGYSWVHPLTPVGDGTSAKRDIQNLAFGDMPDFTPAMQLAYDGLSACDAGQRHVIMISDGDAQTPPTSLLDKFVAKKITVSCVGVYPHGGTETGRMEFIAKYCGGRYYFVNTAAGLATIPGIFVKEAQTVRRSLIWEGTPFAPQVLAGGESIRGLTSVPPIGGYVVMAEREGLSLTTMKGREGDPILAEWQYGLGRVVTFASDAATRWNPAWVAWGNYQQFWEQQLRWVMRPQGNANMKVITENKGDQTVITVEAMDAAGERLNFAQFQGRLAAPDGTGQDVELKQIGPGRYQGVVATGKPGAYVLGMKYAVPDPSQGGKVLQGSVQAAVTRPFADEFRTLEDNAGLLLQVAQLTGGRVLDWDNATSADLWSREGIKMPVSTQPFWLWAAIAALTMFLMDVGVRRVRIDIPAMVRAVRRGFGAAGPKGSQAMGGLKAAREQARAKLSERGKLAPAELETQAREAARQAVKTASAKFEVSEEQLKAAGKGGVAMGGAEAKVTPTRELKKPPGGADEGMGRLLKAKKKAQDEMGEE
ncbi:MAG: glutamine amidotransferase [Phycisphaerales bacterium]